jgi:hypothetical protein
VVDEESGRVLGCASRRIYVVGNRVAGGIFKGLVGVDQWEREEWCEESSFVLCRR